MTFGPSGAAARPVRAPLAETAFVAVLLALSAASAAPALGAAGDAAWLFGCMLAALALLGAFRKDEAREQVVDAHVLAAPAALMGLAAVATVLASTPLAPGGVHPIWASVGRRGGASLDREGLWLGLLQLGGLAAVFLAALFAGLKGDRARGLIPAISAMALVLGVCDFVPGAAVPGTQGEAGGALFGLALILSAATVLSRRRALKDAAQRGGAGQGGGESEVSPLGVIRAAPLSGIVALASATALVLINRPALAACAAVLLLLLALWEFIAGGRSGGLQRGASLVLMAVFAALALATGALVLQKFGGLPDPETHPLFGTHLTALQASPWMGYGLDSTEAMLRLNADRLNLASLAGAPASPPLYLLWVEQGGLIAALAFGAGLAAIIVEIGLRSAGRRRTSGLMRAVVAASAFLALAGLVNAGPAAPQVATIWALLLGLGLARAIAA